MDLCHEAGTLFTYAFSKGSIPLLDQMLEAGVDILQAIDPLMDPYMDMKKLKEITRGKMSLWGGINESLTIQEGSEEEIKNTVEKAISDLGPDGGFVLSPVDNVLLTTEEAWRKVLLFIKVWKEISGI